MMSRFERVLAGALVAGALALPVLSAAAAAKKPAPKKPPAKPAAKGDAAAGKAAFKSEGCIGCHKTKDFAKEGGNTGPDLSKVGGSKPVKEITAYIKKPKAGSTMPAFTGPEKSLHDMGAYLATQK